MLVPALPSHIANFLTGRERERERERERYAETHIRLYQQTDNIEQAHKVPS